MDFVFRDQLLRDNVCAAGESLAAEQVDALVDARLRKERALMERWKAEECWGAEVALRCACRGQAGSCASRCADLRQRLPPRVMDAPVLRRE